jgi:hypothetical protein
MTGTMAAEMEPEQMVERYRGLIAQLEFATHDAHKAEVEQAARRCGIVGASGRAKTVCTKWHSANRSVDSDDLTTKQTAFLKGFSWRSTVTQDWPKSGDS